MVARRLLGLSVCLITLLVVIAAGAGAARAEAPYVQDWARQCGTISDDESSSVAVDASGGVYITGETWGDLGGTNAGLEDAFLVKYNSAGTRLWTKQLGTSASDKSHSVAVSGSGVYITGETGGSLDGQPNAGGLDTFLCKYDVSGSLQWTRQFGTDVWDKGYSVAAAGSSVYITGETFGSLEGTNAGCSDAFLVKYDDSGALQWTRQLGTDGYDAGKSVAVDGSDGVYIAGKTDGSLDGTNAGSYDAFLARYNDSGDLLWTKQLGTTGYDAGTSVAVDGSDGVYIAGLTNGDIHGTNTGGFDAFLAKYDASGNLQWTRQIGTGVHDMDHDGFDSVAVDGSGGVYVTGFTEGDIAGPNAGSDDAFLAKYDTLGNLLWTIQFGTEGKERWNYVALDGSDEVYITGPTGGDLGGTNPGGYDAYLVKYVPEPVSFALLGLGGAALLKRRRRVRTVCS